MDDHEELTSELGKIPWFQELKPEHFRRSWKFRSYEK